MTTEPRRTPIWWPLIVLSVMLVIVVIASIWQHL